MAEPPTADVERLYGLELDEFIPARDATAQRLRGDGRREEAHRIKALRKPSNPAWVVNRLARAEPAVLGELLAAGRRLREVQLGGGGDLREAMDDERGALDRAMRNAEEIATHAKLASRATLDRVRETLHLAALDPDVGEEAERGVLVREGRAAGFTDLAVFAPSAAPRRPAKPDREQAAEQPPSKEDRRTAAAEERAAARERKRREKAAATARDRLAAAERELTVAERDVERARTALEKAERQAEKSRAARDDAAAHLAEIEP